ncbi:hypothetical protein ASZ90_006960 [hydrocarbon metagenome]|uniref:Uncharacterized protein n=1 Tax=hydrocarbon metagenome TaxID=938273 RepID=A0A0W8FSK1_9ZZZZ
MTIKATLQEMIHQIGNEAKKQPFADHQRYKRQTDITGKKTQDV